MCVCVYISTSKVEREKADKTILGVIPLFLKIRGGGNLVSDVYLRLGQD